MATIINHNIEAINSYRNLFGTNLAMAKSLERLSSGYRINRASDDAAGLAISEKMRAQISGLNSALRNAQDAVSLIRTAEGALSEMNADLVRMRELSVLAATDVLTSNDRQNYQDEFRMLQKHVNRIATTTEFNTRVLFDGSLSVGAQDITRSLTTQVLSTANSFTGLVKHLTFQVGANIGQAISVGFNYLGISSTVFAFNATNATKTTTGNATTVGLVSSRAMNGQSGWRLDFVGGLNTMYVSIGMNAYDTQSMFTKIMRYGSEVCIAANGAISLSSVFQATTAMWRIDTAIEKVAAVRAKLGAVENGLNSIMNSLQINVENLQAAESRIRDTDMAKEMTTFTRNQIMAQAGMSMLAQANMQPQLVLSLLR